MGKTRKTKTTAAKEVVLSGSLSLRTAGEIRNELLQAFDEADTVKVLFQDVEDMDLSLLQIFCAAHRSAIQRNKALIMQDRLPEVFVQIVKDAGLNGHIGCSSEEREGCIWQGC